MNGRLVAVLVTVGVIVAGWGVWSAIAIGTLAGVVCGRKL